MHRMLSTLAATIAIPLMMADRPVPERPRQPSPPAAAGPVDGMGLAGAGCDGVRVSSVPERPRQGSLFRIQVSGAPAGADVRGTAAGEPLHFAASGEALAALAAAQIDMDTPVPVTIACTVNGRTDSTTARIATVAATYPLERLQVDPRFATPPDSALAARMRREAARAAEVSRRSHDTPRLWAEPFRRPREARVTSTFGRGREFNGAVTSRHMGTDYAGAVGAPVHAANRGVVRLVDAFYLGGNVIYVDHGAGLVTAYLHLSRQDVAPGDTVQQGDVIGRVGATGRVTGPHLHWITRYGSITVDPASLLRVTAEPAG